MRKFFTLHYWGLCHKARMGYNCKGDTFTDKHGHEQKECGKPYGKE